MVERELDELKKENAALKKRIEELENSECASCGDVNRVKL